MELGVAESRNHIQIQRLALSAGLLCSVENGDLLNRLRDCRNQSVRAERSVQTNDHETNLLALSVQIIDCLLDGLAYRAMAMITCSASGAP